MNLIDQLAPPISPPPPGNWPPAIGWWLVLGFILMLSVAFVQWYRHKPKITIAPLPDSGPTETEAEALESLRKTALEEFQLLERPQPGASASQWLQQINALLKRICRIRYPAAQPHTLSGRAWLAFLDSRCPAAGLTRWMILVEGAYRSECRLEQKALDGLEHSVSIWIQKHA